MNKKRRPLVAGNWKMNKGGANGIELAQEVVKIHKETPHVDLLIAPPYTVLAAIAHEIDGTGVLLSAQNMHGRPHGAFTGEVSSDMLKEAGAHWVILGHSERRHVFGEKDVDIAVKVGHALDETLAVILCVGETLAEREAGKTLEVVRRQFDAVIESLALDPHEEAIAYEPVWAIGTGKNASPQDAEEVHSAIRKWLAEKSPDLAERTRILYGGSVNAANAEALLGMPNVDGLLIGGASLDAAAFGAIARTAEKLATVPAP
jgi:triosephosphate isomerase (TIM)